MLLSDGGNAKYIHVMLKSSDISIPSSKNKPNKTNTSEKNVQRKIFKAQIFSRNLACASAQALILNLWIPKLRILLVQMFLFFLAQINIEIKSYFKFLTINLMCLRQCSNPRNDEKVLLAIENLKLLINISGLPSRARRQIFRTRQFWNSQ